MRVIYSNYLPVKGFRAINLFGIIVARREHGDLEERVFIILPKNHTTG